MLAASLNAGYVADIVSSGFRRENRQSLHTSHQNNQQPQTQALQLGPRTHYLLYNSDPNVAMPQPVVSL